MSNPFRFGQVVRGELFCNRQSEMAQITSDLSGGQSIVLYSPRRYGKTSLLKAISDDLISQGILCGYSDLFACNSTEKIIISLSRAAAKAVFDDLKSVEKFAKKAVELFKRIRFSFTLDPQGSGSVGIQPELSSQALSIDNLNDALNGLNAYLAKTRKRAVIILDEFQQVTRVNENLEAEFRTVIQQQDRIAFAFLGSRMHLLKEMFTDEKRPFYRAAKIMELGPIDEEELARFITKRFKTIGVQASLDVTQAIAVRVKGHPDYTQRLCSHIVDILETGSLDQDTIQKGVERMLVSLTPAFRGIYEELPLRESQVMSLIAEHGPLRTFPSKIIQPYDLGAPALHKALSNLIKKDLVAKDNDKGYTIFDPILSDWIKMVSLGEEAFHQRHP